MANVATHRRTAPTLTVLSAAEIAALALSLAHLGAGPQAATARRALRTLLDTVPHDDVAGVTLATLTASLDASTADRARVVAAAISEHRVVRLCYGDAGANVTIREVEPVTCLVHRDHWYLVGWCRMRRGVRAFRFDRILAVESTGMPARPRRTDRYLPFQRRESAVHAGTPAHTARSRDVRSGTGRRSAAASGTGHRASGSPRSSGQGAPGAPTGS